jgi:thioredoxin-dependent peroxiredoxin
VFGVSYDDAASHRAFRDKYQLTSALLVDPEKKVGAAYGINTGDYADRRTIVISSDGHVAAILETIDFGDHAGQILAALEGSGA